MQFNFHLFSFFLSRENVKSIITFSLLQSPNQKAKMSTSDFENICKQTAENVQVFPRKIVKPAFDGAPCT